LAQFAYNSSPAATGVLLFYANYRIEPTAFRTLKNIEALAQRSTINVRLLKHLHDELSKDIEFIAIRSSIYYDKKRSRGPSLEKGDPVYLLRKNIKIKRPS
jgi:hypothetical protein